MHCFEQGYNISAQIVVVAYTTRHARNLSIYEDCDLLEDEILRRPHVCVEEYHQANRSL